MSLSLERPAVLNALPNAEFIPKFDGDSRVSACEHGSYVSAIGSGARISRSNASNNSSFCNDVQPD